MSLSHSLGRLFQAVQNADRLLLVTHRQPDGDALGSTSAFLNWCLREGKDATMFCVDPPPPALRFLDHVHRATNDPAVFERPYDLVIFFDCGDMTIAGVDELFLRLPEEFTLVNVDHHRTNPRFGHLNIVEEISSTSEIVYRFFKQNHVTVDETIATSLLTGVCSDTSNFSNPLTSAAALEAASELVKNGARFNDILRHIWRNKTFDSLKLWGVILSRLYHNKASGAASAYVRNGEMEGGQNEIVEGMTNFLSAMIAEANMIMLLKEQEDGRIKGSLRGTDRDVSKIAKLLGGGGHPGAAGFTIEGRLVIEGDGRPAIQQETRTLYPDLIEN
jgi:phosphoesterase RecJ-like protein